MESLEESRSPSQSKDANVTPIFKKMSRVVAANYRSVSLISVIYKLIENIVRDCFMRYLEEESLISKAQHGFVRVESRVPRICWRLSIL